MYYDDEFCRNHRRHFTCIVPYSTIKMLTDWNIRDGRFFGAIPYYYTARSDACFYGLYHRRMERKLIIIYSSKSTFALPYCTRTERARYLKVNKIVVLQTNHTPSDPTPTILQLLYIISCLSSSSRVILYFEQNTHILCINAGNSF